MPGIIAGLFGLAVAIYNNPEQFETLISNPLPDPLQKKLVALKEHKPPYRTKFIRNDSNPSASSLSQLYEENNNSLNSFMKTSIKDINEAEYNNNRLLYLTAGAGVGKSTYFNERYGDPLKLDGQRTTIYYPDTGIYLRVEDLKKWFSCCGSEPDLVKIQSRKAVNNLPGDLSLAKDTLYKLIEAIDLHKINSIIVLDGVDEIGNKLANSLLEEIDKYLSARPSGGINIIVSGRPEGFKDYYRRRQNRQNILFSSSTFNPPVYQQRNALKTRYDNYTNWRLAKRGIQSPSFSDLEETLKSHPFLIDDFSILMLSGPIISHSDTWHLEDAFVVKEILFGEIMDRNQYTHQRPEVSNNHYPIALEEVVLNHLTLLNEKGAFYVNPHATVNYEDDKVNVRDLLHKSGLISFHPGDVEKFYFVPSWIPEFLLERRYKRMQVEE